MIRKSVQIRVLKNIIPLSGEEYAWHSVGDSPLFSIEHQLPICGWNLLEFSTDHSISSASAHFYFDMGHGFSEEDKIVLPLRRGRVVKRVCFFPASIREIRFDPLGSEGKFTIKHFRFKKLIPWVAYKRLLKRLMNLHHLYHRHTKRQILKQIKKEARASGVHWRNIALKRYDETFTKSCSTLTYSSWIKTTEKLQLPDENMVAQQMSSLSCKPIISVLLPIYNRNVNHVSDSIESVLDQSYGNWQLCIICVGLSEDVTSILERFVEKDKRIDLRYQSSDEQPVSAFNTALSLAEGDYITVLSQNDLLAKHAFLKYMSVITEASEDVCLIYSDEDEVNDRGDRFNPCFKPDWNLDLLLSQNYISHAWIIRAELIQDIGGFRESLEESQQYDLLLRSISQLNDMQIKHVPEILYHCRSVLESDFGVDTDAGIKALTNYFSENNKEAVANKGILPNTYNVNWSIPEPYPLVSVIIPTKDNRDVFKCCLSSILEKTTYPNIEIIILNNQSSCAETLKYLNDISIDKRVTVYNWNHSFNYSAINNFGAKKAKGSILALLNDDVEVISPNWLNEMVSHACRSDIGCVGAKLYYSDDKIQHAGIILGLAGVAGHAHKYFDRSEDGYFSRLKVVQNYSAVTGACLVVRKDIFNQIGGFDEKNLTIAFNDVDLCLKVRDAGYRNLWTPYAELYHLESHSRGKNNSLRKRKRADREAEYMLEHWGDVLFSDPAYNPNLTLVHEDFSLK